MFHPHLSGLHPSQGGRMPAKACFPLTFPPHTTNPFPSVTRQGSTSMDQACLFLTFSSFILLLVGFCEQQLEQVTFKCFRLHHLHEHLFRLLETWNWERDAGRGRCPDRDISLTIASTGISYEIFPVTIAALRYICVTHKHQLMYLKGCNWFI